MTIKNPLQLENEIERIARSMMTRNSEVGKDIISYMRKQLTVEELAGLLLVSIDRIIWFDLESVLWTLEYIIPVDLIQEMKKITTTTLYQQLIRQKFLPGQDFSMDAEGKLLLNNNAQTALLCR